MKKWTTVLSDTESIEIAGQEQKVQIKECMDNFVKLHELQSSLMNGQKDNALNVVADILLQVGFFTKNI